MEQAGLVNHIHSRVNFPIGLLVLVLIVAWQASHTNRAEIRRRALGVAGLLMVQGSVGYLQYFTGVPVLLVGIHVTLASLVWISIVRLHLHLRPVGITARVLEWAP